MPVVTRKRVLPAALALLVGVTLQTAQAAPARMLAQMRAKSCSAAKCHRMGSLARAMQCCRVAPDTGETVTLSTARVSPEPAPLWVPTASNPGPAAPAQIALRTTTAGSCRAGPIFLQTRSLRL